MDIKETKEVIEGLRLVAIAGAKAMSDGRINAADLQYIVTLLTAFGVLVDAVKGAEKIPGEMKELSSEELIELGTLIYSTVKDVVTATKP